MSAWIVYSKDGLTERCELHAVEYGGTHMGERAVTATFESDSKVDFDIFDYLSYRGEVFELESVPTVKKTSSFEYSYELRFVSRKYELERCEMRDLVPSDNGVVYPTPLSFSFTGDVRYLTDRIQACLDDLYGEGVWNIVIADGVESEEKNITIAQQNCWNALALVNSTYGLDFYIKGRVITIGGSQPVVSHVFEYGKGNGLYEIERAANTDTAIVTKLRAYGSDRNLDYSYPKKPEWSDSNLPVSFAFSPLRLMLPSFKVDKTDYVLADEETIKKYGIREASIVYEDIYPSITGATHNGQAIDEIKAVDVVDDNASTFVVYLHDLGFDLEAHLTTADAQISMKSGAMQGYTFTISNIEKQEDNSYKITLGRVSAEGGENYNIPNSDWNMREGDKFVLLNILMPQKYIREAENRLKQRAEEYLAQYSKTNFGYNIGLHDKFLIENPSVYDALIEGSKLSVYDEELGISEDVTIQSVTITENAADNTLPQVKVTLNNEPSASTLDRIQGKIDSLANESAANNFATQSEIMAQYRKKLDKPFFDKLFAAVDAEGNEIPSTDTVTPVAYIKARYDFAVVGGVTMYLNDGSLDLPDIFDGIPVDNDTIYWDGDVLKSRGVGEGGVTPTLLGDLTNVGVWANTAAAETRIMVQKKGSSLWEELPLNSIGCTDKDNTNGLGYKVLHKDIPIDEQVIATNTIYEVRYDFYLNGSLNIPSGCVLKFDGGSINGGSVVFNKTKLVGDVKLYSSISGSLGGGIANIDWFVDDSSSDVTDILNQLLSIVKRVEFCSRTYHVNGTINVPSGKQLIGNGCAISASGSVDLFSIESNARGNIIENMTLYTSYSSSKAGAAIRLNSSNGGADHIYRDLYINEFAYGIYASEVWWGNTVENVKCTACGHSFVILGTGGQSINNTFIRCYSNNPYVRGITLGAVKSCTFINCNNGCDTGGTFLQVQTNCQGVKFVGCNFEGGLMKNNQYLFNLTSGSIINFDTCTFVKLLKYDSSQNNTIAMRVMNTCQVTLIDCTGLSNEYVNFALAQNDAKVYIRNLNGVGSFVSYNNASVVNMVNYLQKSLWDKSFEFTENRNGDEVLNAKLPINGYLKSQGYLPEGSVDSTTLGVYSVGGYSPSGAEYTYGTLVALNSVAGCAQIHFTDSRNNLGGQAFFRSVYINGGTETLDAEWTEFITSKNIEKQSVDSANTLSTPRKLWGQDFDGSEDVSGDLSNVGNIIPTTNNTFKIGESANRQWENVFSREVTVDGITIKKSETGVLYIDGTLAVSGGVTSFAVEEEQIANVMDGVVVDETTIIKRGNKLMLNPDITLGGGSSNWTDIAGKPTTISGYGITDAKISNGTITLGNSTITPLTRTTADSLYLGKNESVDMAEKDGNGSVIADTYFKNRGYATSSNIKSTTIGAYSVSGYSPSGADYTYGSVLSFPSSAGLVQMHFTDGRNALGNQLFFRNQYTSGGVRSISSDWVEVITSKNISDFPVEASSLSKTCSIWGQDFDGTGDVDGRLYDVTGINDIDIESNGQVVVPSSEAATMLLKRTKSGGAFIRCYPNNQDSKTWSIGVDNLYNAAWFYVDSSSGVDVRRMYLSSEGNLTITGSLSQGSDVRYKNIHKEIVLPLDFMADAPCFEYDFIDDESCRTHLGTSAQYWESVEGIVSRDNDGRYCMDYSSLGVVMGISIAKEFTAYKKDMDKRMEELCKEMKALRMEVEFLKNK